MHVYRVAKNKMPRQTECHFSAVFAICADIFLNDTDWSCLFLR